MTSQLVFLKELGVGAAIAVLIDAFVVRGLLVPALMGYSAVRTGGRPVHCAACTTGWA